MLAKRGQVVLVNWKKEGLDEEEQSSEKMQEEQGENAMLEKYH